MVFDFVLYLIFSFLMIFFLMQWYFQRESTNGDFEDRAESQPRNHDDPKQDEWRRERSKIDQERINRQKTSDGNWSREWDNNKVLQE